MGQWAGLQENRMTSSIKRVFFMANFKTSGPSVLRIDARHWCKGFVRNGLDVLPFSYRDVLEQQMRLPFRKLGRKRARAATEKLLLNQIRIYRPDLIVVFGGKGFDANTIEKMRLAAPGVPIVGRDADAWPEGDPLRSEIARSCDMMVVTNAGKWMEYYKSLDVKRVAFFPCPCDPDLHRLYPADPVLGADVVFTGKATHKQGCDPDRETIVKRLMDMPNARVYGAQGERRAEGVECFMAYSNAKIILSINADNSVPLYHSNRLFLVAASGSMVLAKRIPQGELLFRDHEHLRYFDTPEEFFELLDYYLAHDEERETIAAAGMKHCHEEFNSTRMAGLLLDLVQTGSYDAEWGKVL